MLEGLEVNIKSFNQLINEGDNTLRFDSEHYQKKYQIALNLIISKNHAILKTIIKQDVITGHTPPMSINRYYDGNIKFIKTDNLRENNITYNFSHYLSEEGNMLRVNSQLKEGDIITTIIGATFDIVGRTSIVQKEILPANINQNIALIRLDEAKMSPSFLNIYLNTKYGRSILHYHSRQTEQVNLNCREIERIVIPIFKNLEIFVSDVVYKIEDLKINIKKLYDEAEKILFKEVGLENFKLNKEAINIKTFKESFVLTKRLDAEYYQKKYEQVVEKITAQKHDALSRIVNISKSIEPGSNQYSEEEGLPFYRVADYSKLGLSKPDKELTNSFVAENTELIERLKPKKGTILFSKDGSVGTAYLLRDNLDGITSSAILHLQIKNPKEIIPEYLTLALNSKLVQMQAERDAGGSIILHWRKEEIEQVVVPIIEIKKQLQIAELVEESFKLKAESERLLEVAKKAVEMAIEKNEEVAMKFIKENTN